MSSRDNFSTSTKERLAHSAGYRCSKPDCGITTRGAASDGKGTINIGVAAHITAASPRGPRFDPKLTIEQRKAFSNGLWLCENHGKLVDSDESQFTVEELHTWKRLAQRRSFLEVVASKPNPLGARLADDDDVQTSFDLLLGYSSSDLSAFQQLPDWPSHIITLKLRILDGDNAKVFDVSGLASGIDVFDEIAVIAAPGTGKTTTLLQLAEATLANAAFVPVFIPLSEWATMSDTFFRSVLRRIAFKDAREGQFALLAQHGKLVLLFDGWNELDASSRIRARNELNALRRDFPDIRIVISSRHKDFDIPIDGSSIEVKPLTEEQQLDLAKSLRGSDGESLMDHAWRTRGLRELVAIPLYLTALLKQAPGGHLPTTKEEILRSFVAELEQDPDKQANLRQALQEFHREFLEEIAVEATGLETVALSKAQSRAAVNTVQKRLKDENQIAELLQPMNVLDALIDSHMLVRSDTQAGGVSFQHQQFQEWFASFHVEQLMLSTASGDDDANKRLRESILDLPVWEEAILFACDRLSRANQDGQNATAHAILETLGIDPLLSAEMIWRSSDDVWEQISDDVIVFVRKWHTPGRVDRAVKFMIDTGRAEFSEFVWPLVSSEDDQVHLHALRAGRTFRPSVLGSDAEEQITALPEDVRENIISEIASNGGMDGVELATSMAKIDASPKVKASVIESLVFRCADRFAKEILESAQDEVWRSLARNCHSHEFADPEVSARIQEEADKVVAEETDPGRIMNTILRTNVRNADDAQTVRELVERIDFSDKEKVQNNMWVIHRAHALYPDEVIKGLLSLLKQGKPVPFRSDELLLLSDVVVDDGPLVDCVLKHSGDGRTAANAASVVGPKTVSQLIDQVVAVHTHIRTNNGRYDESLSEEYHRLMDLVSCTKINSFTRAVLERANTKEPHKIYLLTELISRHGGSVERERLRLASETHERIAASVQRWARILLASPEATRPQFANIAQAAERLESPELVPVLLELLAEDLARQKRAWEERLEARKQGQQIQNDAHMRWTRQYRLALAAIGDPQTVHAMKTYLRDPEFGFDAAHVLKAVWRKSRFPGDESGFGRGWPDFSVVPEAYTRRRKGTEEETHPFVDEIVAAINDLIKPAAPEPDLTHALRLATVAFSMPYAGKRDTISALLELRVPAVNKRDLLTVLVLSGEMISSKIVLRGIDDLLEEAKTNPWVIHDQDGWRLKEWLRLLPFTERPSAVLEVLDRVKGFRADPWNLRSLLSALGYAPSSEAERVLEELAKRDERFLGEHEWFSALTNRNTLSAARIVLDLICNASFPEPLGSLGHSHLGRTVSELMTSHDQLRKDIYERFLTIDDGAARSVLECAIAEAADMEGVLLLTRQAAAQDKRFQSTKLYTALEKVLVGYKPIESSAMQQLYSRPASELRKSLFDLVMNGSAAEARLAAECLNAIDEFRDRYGYVDSEPRHPDVAAGPPWPQLNVERA